MNKKWIINLITYTILLLLVGAITTVIIKIPSWVSKWGDEQILGFITTEEKTANVIWGYQDEDEEYIITIEEELYLLSSALNNRILPQSDYYARTRWFDSITNPQIQSYAFQLVTNENFYNRQTIAQAFITLQAELATLSVIGILPPFSFTPDLDEYEASLYSAIDILDPHRNVLVWQIVYRGITSKTGLMDCIMDANTGKIYSISIRVNRAWEDYDTDVIVTLWAEYIGSGAPEPYVPDSPRKEDATYYEKYFFSDTAGNKTIITLGYYEPVQEFFIKIAR